MKVILLAIIGQRALFYGFRALLFTSLLHKFVIDASKIGLYYGIFVAVAVLSPIIGGMIADRIGTTIAARLGLGP